MSQFKIDQLTSDAVVKVQRLKEDLNTLYEGYEEYLAQRDLDDTDANKIIKTVNPELQHLYEGLADDKLDVILNMDPNTGNWLFLPIEKGKKTYKKLKDGMKMVDGEIKDSQGNDVANPADAYEEVDWETAADYLANPEISQDMMYNIYEDSGIVDGTNLTALSKEGNMFETVPENIDEISKELQTQIMDLYHSGMFQSVDETGKVKSGRPMSKAEAEKKIKAGGKIESFLDQEAAFNYFTQDPEGVELLNTFIDPLNKNGLAQGLGIKDYTTLGEKDFLPKLQSTLMQSALLRIAAPQTGISATDKPLDDKKKVNTMLNKTP